jgi:hypothetical protein
MTNFYKTNKRRVKNLISRYIQEYQRFQNEKPLWTSAEYILHDFLSRDFETDNERYSELFLYFVCGFLHYRGSNLAHVYYPGAKSGHTIGVDAMEGFCRFIPMISSWITSGRDKVIQDFDGNEIDLIEIVKSGIVAGTSPNHADYWGDICDYDQRIIEAADVALSIWLLHDYFWVDISATEKYNIENWLCSVNKKQVHNNNWLLSVVLINEVLFTLGNHSDRDLSLRYYKKFKTFYRGNGWFSDGPQNVYDYYNAWGIHYTLSWINHINAKFDNAFIEEVLREYVQTYKYFFSPEGFPITGRSICYRMAAPAPLIAAVENIGNNISPGLARRALNVIWEHFISHNAVYNGRITQGYWHDDMRLLDSYSGPASPLWSLRSLIIAFYYNPNLDFWTAKEEKLPVEKGSYRISIPGIKWEIKGNSVTNDIEIIKNESTYGNEIKIESQTTMDVIKEKIMCLPYRPENTQAKYKLKIYSSLRPFFIE